MVLYIQTIAITFQGDFMLDSKTLITTLRTQPNRVSFADTMAVIEVEYTFQPSAFTNGKQINQENENNGSCKIFAFAKLHELNVDETLHLFGDYYRQDVLEQPTGQDHQNIRQFIECGWDGIHFSHSALTPKK